MAIHLNLIFPMAAMVSLTVVVLGAMFRVRMAAVQRREIKISYFKTYTGDVSEALIKTSRHFSNLFETPVLFYAACLAAMIAPLQGPGFVYCAWLYVAARIVHAYIHLGQNNVRGRMWAYASSWVFLLIMWAQLVLVAAST